MRTFIVIDNDSQEDEIANIEGKAKSEGFEVKGFWFNSDDSACLTLINGKYRLDKEKILARLKSEYDHKISIDVILVDFKLGDEDDKTDGVDLVLFLKENEWRSKVPVVMFSGDYDLLMEKLQKDWHPGQFEGKFEEQYKKMRDYFKHLPQETFKKENFFNTFWSYLKTVPINMERILLDGLNEYPEEVFENIHPMFNGKKLKEISKMIKSKSSEGEEFKKEMMERSIAHFIHLKE